AVGNMEVGYYINWYGLTNTMGSEPNEPENYGLYTADLQVGYANDRGRVGNHGWWRIDGNMNINPDSSFHNWGNLETDGSVTLQNDAFLEVMSGKMTASRISA